MSHAMALEAGNGGKGCGPSRTGGLADRGEQKRIMDPADRLRRGDRVGRGNLSETALKTYCEWFPKVTRYQITVLAKVFDLGWLEKRYRRLALHTFEDKRARDLISAVLRHGGLDRGEAPVVPGTSAHRARNRPSKSIAAGCLSSASPKAPARPAFPLDDRERPFRNLFADGDLTPWQSGGQESDLRHAAARLLCMSSGHLLSAQGENIRGGKDSPGRNCHHPRTFSARMMDVRLSGRLGNAFHFAPVSMSRFTRGNPSAR